MRKNSQTNRPSNFRIQPWLKKNEVKTLYIKPGSPWENDHIESFHDKLRDECLNRELFGSLLEAQIILEQWRNEYNHERPHSSLEYKTPSEYAAVNRADGGCAPPNPAPLAAEAFGGNFKEALTRQRNNNQQPAELYF